MCFCVWETMHQRGHRLPLALLQRPYQPHKDQRQTFSNTPAECRRFANGRQSAHNFCAKTEVWETAGSRSGSGCAILHRFIFAQLVHYCAPKWARDFPRLRFRFLFFWGAKKVAESVDIHCGMQQTERTMSSKIHPTAIIDEGAKLGENCEIGPYVVIDKGAVIGN